MPFSFDVVLPCYNPQPEWIIELQRFKDALDADWHVNFIVVDDGSAKPELLKQLENLQSTLPTFQFISYPVNRGKGFALRKGMELSQAEYVIYTDCDFPFTNDSMKRLLKALVQNTHDIVVGYRNEAYYEKKMTLFRKALSKAFRFFVSKGLKMPVTDTQCGLKGFNKKGKVKFLSTTINRYLFDFEFIFLACKDSSLKILPVQVQLKENVVFSKMRLKIILQEFFNLFRILVFR